jgi:predicted phage tail protein
MKKLLMNIAVLLSMAVVTFALTVSWSPNDESERITSYRVYAAKGSEPFQLLTNTSSTSYTMTNASPGVYRFYVRAVNFWSDVSDPSAEVATPPPASQMKMLYVVVGPKTNVVINLQ